MKKINWTVVSLAAVSITEIVVLHQLGASIALWVLYGLYRFFSGFDGIEF